MSSYVTGVLRTARISLVEVNRVLHIVARLNFLAFALRDIKITTREGCRVGQMMSAFTRRNIFSMCRSSRAIIFRFNSKTQRQMFLLLYGRHVCHVCVPQKGTNMAFPHKAL